MSWFGDALKFEAFNAKDMWKKIAADPERLLVGAVDPFGTKVANSILGKDYEPIVDQMGGPYGGSTFSMFNNKQGGVYGRAEDAGINTGPAGGIHDVAHIIAAMYGGQGLQGAYGNVANAGTGADASLGVFANGGKAGMAGVGGGNAGALASSGAITGGAGVGGTGAYGAQFGEQFNQYSKLMNQAGGMMGSNPIAPIPAPTGGGGYASSTPTTVNTEGGIERNERPKDRRGFAGNRMGPFMYRGQIVWV